MFLMLWEPTRTPQKPIYGLWSFRVKVGIDVSSSHILWPSTCNFHKKTWLQWRILTLIIFSKSSSNGANDSLYHNKSYRESKEPILIFKLLKIYVLWEFEDLFLFFYSSIYCGNCWYNIQPLVLNNVLEWRNCKGKSNGTILKF